MLDFPCADGTGHRLSRRRFLAACGGFGALGAGRAGADENHRGAIAGGTRLGIDTLAELGFSPLKGDKVGLLTHPAGVNAEGVATVDVMRQADGFKLTKLYGPEHGIYGDEKANVPIDDRTDPRTGLPVYSLYGRYRKPTPEMLKGLDTLVVDLQDIGSRSYTYVSCMKLAMEACYERGVRVMVLDRPNPLGGQMVDGPPMDERWMSYVGAFRVPYVHGLTIGELARMASAQPGWLDIDAAALEAGELLVVPMGRWGRDTLWHRTGLSWVPTSPAVPTVAAALGYGMTGLGCQLSGFRHGYGTNWPFRLVSHKTHSARSVYEALRRLRLPGMDFHHIAYKHPNGSRQEGVYVESTGKGNLRPTALSFHLMRLACQLGGDNPFAKASHAQATLFNKHVGSTAWWKALVRDGARVDVERFLAEWEIYAKQFRKLASEYWIYA